MPTLIEEIEKPKRSAELVQNLLDIWEKSVRATHTFLSEEEILKIKEYVLFRLTRREKDSAKCLFSMESKIFRQRKLP